MLWTRQLAGSHPRFSIIFGCVFATLVFGLYHSRLYRQGELTEKVGYDYGYKGGIHTDPSPPPVQALPLESLIEELFKPIRHDFTSPFINPSGSADVWKHSNNLYEKPLRKDVLILDVDTRYPEKLFNNNKVLSWEQLDSNSLLTQSVFNHYLYAKIHGYDYQYYQPSTVPDHHDTWPKVHSIANLLPKYKFVIFLDSDAEFRHLALPIEWLFNRWNITSETSLAMARDPLNAECDLCDTKGVTMVNTGFIVAQNIPHTHKIFQEWMTCTSERTYKDCGKWKETWAHEQSVMSEYLRYDFNPDGHQIRELECGEANGFPGHPWYDEVECNGRFVRHHTFLKNLVKDTTSNATMQIMMEALKARFTKGGEENKIIVNEDREREGAWRGVGDGGDGGEREEEVYDHS